MRTAVPALMFASLCLAALTAAPAQAQATRTWVASTPAGGNDVNACSRTAPCKTFSGALSKTSAGGVVSCVDADGYGPVTITKSITIDCTGVGAGILGPVNGSAVIVNGANVVVLLRGLTIVAAANAQYGVRFLNGSELHIENSTVSGFGIGVDFSPLAGVTSRLVVANSSINANTGGGLNIAAAGNAKILLDHARLDGNAGGIYATASAGGSTRMTIKNSSLSANENYGISADGTGGGPVQVLIDSSVVSNNGSFGIVSGGPNATVIVCCSTVAGNDTGWTFSNGAGLGSYQNNNVNMNITNNGTPSFPAAQQ